MHYALYRKYRPLTFSDVVGQSHITKTLTNQVENSQLSHAYLFCGTRGTGKTSCAKILSRAVNCLSPINGEPCNECEVCQGILDGSIFDVMEIDAASNNGVENIRQIRDEIIYTPVKAKYKVYIIDEVHMLSSGAFNALLKTLEEPPAHVIFILATTESHKIPATILSRCQRFDFKRLSVKDISDQIYKILKLENKTADDKTVRLVATLADGSVRDSLSILEKVAESSSYEEAESILGVIGRRKLYGIAESIANTDIDAIYKFIDELYFSSKDLTLLINELTAVFRDLLAVKSAVSADSFLDKSEDDIKELKNLSKKYSYEHIVYAMDTLFEASQSFSRSPDKRAATELCLVKIAKPVFSEKNDALIARLGKLENQLKDIEVNGVKLDVRNAAPIQKTEPVAQKKSEPASRPAVNEKPVTPPQPQPKIVEKAPEIEDIPIPPPPEEYLPPIPMEDFFEEADIPEEKPTPQVQSSPITTAEPVSSDGEDGAWQEFMALKDIADAVREKNRGLGALLANYCRAVYNKKQIVILCDNDRDLTELKTPQSISKISEALTKNRRIGYEIKVAKGNVNDYVKNNSTYENIENNGYFDFS